MASYEDALRTFNETVANLNQIAEVQYVGTAGEINAIQASSMDPSDMGAYNLTMYGMNQVRDSQAQIVSTVGDVNNYRLPGEAAALVADPTPAATSATYAVEHTSISSSLTSFTVPDNLFSPFFNDPSCILPTNTPSLWLVYGIFGLLLGKFLILKR